MNLDTETRAHVQQICAVLLRYPKTTTSELISLAADDLRQLPDDATGELRTFADYLCDTSLMDVQRHYVETFDMRRKCSPYLTYWTHGDTRNRGMALLHFKEVYRQAGLTIGDDELPDHLSVVLEFAGAGDRALGSALLAEHRGVIALLHDALAGVGSPYAHVVRAALATTSELTLEDERLMARLAGSGPPSELVGMAGPVDLALSPFALGDASTGARR
jgi:nitrate reductase delta subunit